MTANGHDWWVEFIAMLHQLGVNGVDLVQWIHMVRHKKSTFKKMAYYRELMRSGKISADRSQTLVQTVETHSPASSICSFFGVDHMLQLFNASS